MNVLWTSYELLLPADLDVFPCMRSLKFDAAMLLRYAVPCMHNAKFNVATIHSVIQDTCIYIKFGMSFTCRIAFIHVQDNYCVTPCI